MQTLLERAKNAENEIQEYGLPFSFIEKFVFEELAECDVGGYDLNEVLSRKFIDSILERGAKIINAQRTGKKLYNLGARGTELKAPSSEKYENLFEKWEKAGWIKISKQSDSQLIVCINK